MVNLEGKPNNLVVKIPFCSFTIKKKRNKVIRNRMLKALVTDSFLQAEPERKSDNDQRSPGEQEIRTKSSADISSA